MATQNLGRVGLVLKGEWDSSTAYTALDVVSHDGNAWAAKQNSTNVEPTTGNSDFWQLFSNNADLVATVQGLKEDAANSATAAAASAADAESSAQYGEDAFNAITHMFDPGVDYTAGKYVWYNGELYRFNVAHPAGAWIGTDAARYTATDEFPLIRQELGTKADAAEVAELKSALNELLPVNLVTTYTNGKVVNYSTGALDTNANAKATDYIDLTGISAIQYSRIYSTSSSATLGIAFYDGNKTFISGIRCVLNQSVAHYALSTAIVPDGAKYVRLTMANSLGEIVCYDLADVESKVVQKTENLVDRVNDANKAVDNITGVEIIELNKGYYIDTSAATIDDSAIMVSTTGYGYAVVPCSEGDIFTINGGGGSTARLWAFINDEATNNRISVSPSNATGNDLQIVAPTGATKLIINSNIPGACFKGVSVESEVGSLHSITENIIREHSTVKVYPSGSSFNSSTNTRTIYFECTPGRKYIIDKKFPTYEFFVGWSAEKPAAGNSCTQIGSYGDTKTSVTVVAPQTAGYLYAYIYNENRPQDTDIGTWAEVDAKIEIKEITAVDTFCRDEVDVINSHMGIDASDGVNWEIGSLGSEGNNYDRNYEIRTVGYLPIAPLLDIKFDMPLSSRFCVYNSSKTFLHRYQEENITGFNLATIKNKYPTTEYIRFTVYEDTTPLEDTSLSENVHIIRAATLTEEEAYTLDNIDTPDVIALHKGSKSKAATFKMQRTSSEAYGNASLKLLFFTDVHNEIGRVERAVTLMNNWGSSFFDVAVNGGDTTLSIYDATQLAKYDAQIEKSTIPVLNTIGNHDAYSTLDGARPLVPQTTIYEAITAKVKESVPGIVQPDDAEENGLNYYYYDVGSIRIVILDCMYWDATELAWFKSVLSDAITNTKAVISVAHYNFVSTVTEYVNPCTWNPSGYGVGGSASYPLPIEAAQAVKEFQDNDGEFIIWLCGHSHGDSIKKLLPEYGNQYQLICSSFVNRAGTVFKSTDPYSYNYDVLTYIVVDTYYKIVKGMRIGANINEQGMEYNTFSIKYDTGEFLSSC